MKVMFEPRPDCPQTALHPSRATLTHHTHTQRLWCLDAILLTIIAIRFLFVLFFLWNRFSFREEKTILGSNLDKRCDMKYYRAEYRPLDVLDGCSVVRSRIIQQEGFKSTESAVSCCTACDVYFSYLNAVRCVE